MLSPVAAAVVLLLAVDFGVTGDGCCEVSLDVESARDDSDLTSFFDDFTAISLIVYQISGSIFSFLVLRGGAFSFSFLLYSFFFFFGGDVLIC